MNRHAPFFRRAALCGLLAVGALLAGATVAGEVYRWTDANGEVHFGDSPPGGAKAEKLDIQPTPTLPGMVPRDDSSATEPPAPPQANEGTGACDQARWALAALESGRPVYRDEDGAFRVKRPPTHPDSYTGERTYLTDAERNAEITRQRQALERGCADFPALKDKQTAEEDLFRAENCENATARWNELSQPDAYPDVNRLENARKELARWCDPPAKR